MLVDDYIKLMAASSKTPEHEMILECLDHYKLSATKDLTLDQAAEFWKEGKKNGHCKIPNGNRKTM